MAGQSASRFQCLIERPVNNAQSARCVPRGFWSQALVCHKTVVAHICQRCLFSSFSPITRCSASRVALIRLPTRLLALTLSSNCTVIHHETLRPSTGHQLASNTCRHRRQEALLPVLSTATVQRCWRCWGWSEPYGPYRLAAASASTGFHLLHMVLCSALHFTCCI